MLVLGVGVLLLALVLGSLAVVDRVRGGASSPTVLADRVTAALADDDLAGLARLVEPGERAALQRLADGWSRRLAELDLPDALDGGSAASAGSDPLAGLDLTLTGTSPGPVTRSGDVAVVALPDLGVHVRTDPAATHGLLRAWLTWRRVGAATDASFPAAALPGGLDARVVAVERSGRWYLSVLGTLLGPGVADGSTLDVGELTPAYAASPASAVEATLETAVSGLAGRELTGLAATLDPSGADLTQLWAGEVATDGVELGGRVDALQATAGPGDDPADGRVAVRVDRLRVSGAAELDLAGGCAVTRDERTCLHPSGYRYGEGVGGLSWFALLGHDGGFWLTAVRSDGGWRTSLPDSVADTLLAYANHLSRPQLLALLRRPTLDEPSTTVLPDAARDVVFTDAGYALVTLHLDHAGLYRVAPSPAGTSRAAVYDADGQPSIQPYYPNDSVYSLAAGDHRLIVWADDAFGASLDDPATPYVQRVEVRSVR